MDERKVGVVGLGNMGGGIARNFQRAGVPLAVWDVVPAAREALAAMPGVEVATPGQMAASCGTIFFIVPATPEIADCFDGPDGVLAQAAPGLVVYDFTTSDPVETKKLADPRYFAYQLQRVDTAAEPPYDKTKITIPFTIINEDRICVSKDFAGVFNYTLRRFCSPGDCSILKMNI